jgi:basic membrane protein A and related proteins
MSKKIYSFFALLLVTVMILSACAPAAQPTEEAEPVATEEPAEVEEPVEPEEPADEGFKACQVTDTGGIDDQSFNATAWKGIEDAMTELDVEGKYLESQQQTDYEKNINAFIEDGCDIIVTVGFLLGDATAAMAEANPDQKFSIVDFAYDPGYDNVLGQVFNTQEAAFLAGYVAAAVSKTGKVGTFGGIQIPPVTVFMDGYALGVEYYNKEKGANVEVLGWDPYTATGLFTGNFESTDDGRTMGESLMDEGADVIMPVAGPVGFGTAAAAQERGNVYIIGVDSDWYLTAPDYKDIVLTSVLKKMDVTTLDAIKTAMDGTFAGGVTVGTLENGGVGLAPFHDLESLVPTDVTAELETIKAGIIDGSLSAVPGEAPEAEPAATDLGTEENPIIWVLTPSQDTQKVIAGAEPIAAYIEEETGLVVKPIIPTDYTAQQEAMCSEEAHMAALNTFGYVRSKERGCADAALASARYGSTSYAGQIITQAGSDVESIEDLAGKTFCRPDPESTSGWVIPSLLMLGVGIDPEADLEQIIDAGGHDAVVISVYNGDCDAGSTFEDARSNVEEEFTDVMEKVVVVEVTAPIPNDNISFRPDFPEEMRAKIVEALLKLNDTEEGVELLNGLFSWSGLEAIDDTFYDGFRQQLEAAGLTIEEFGQ